MFVGAGAIGAGGGGAVGGAGGISGAIGGIGVAIGGDVLVGTAVLVAVAVPVDVLVAVAMAVFVPVSVGVLVIETTSRVPSLPVRVTPSVAATGTGATLVIVYVEELTEAHRALQSYRDGRDIGDRVRDADRCARRDPPG